MILHRSGRKLLRSGKPQPVRLDLFWPRAKSWEKAKGLERELAPGPCLVAPPARIELTTNP